MQVFHLKKGARICIDFENSSVISMEFRGEEMISGRTPLFFVKLRNALGAHRIVSSNECEFVSFDGEKAVYTHEAIGVTLIFKLRGAGLAVRIRIKNKTKDLIEWAQPFCFGLSGKLKDEGGAGEIVYPFNEGCLVTDMKKRMSMPFKYIEPEYPSLGKYSIFPNMICSQFIGYIKNGKGIYMGMHDKERTVKHIDFDYEKEDIKLVMRTFCDTDFAQDYCMPFDLAIEFFEGDYFDCTEIYRKWFYKHLPAGLKKTDEESLPGWYEESPIVVTYPVRGKFDTDTMTPNPALYPYANALPFLGEISRQTGAKVMALLMHWEGTAPWAPPYVWPPYGGEKIFSEFIEKAHAEGILTGVYCSGMGWTQKSKLEDYSKEKQFKEESLKKIMCSDTNGDIKSEICTQQREGYDLCPAVKKCRDILTEEYNKIVHSGVDYVQVFDQNHGGNSYFCYSRNHGHTPAPGKWQIKAVNEILNAIDRSRVLLGCESAAAEPFISALKFSDNRWNLNEYTGESIPIYAYLYHEFVNNFMGNQICMMLSDEEYNYTYRSAYSFLAGDMLTLVLRYDGVPVSSWGKNKKPLDESVVYPFLKELTLWRTHAGKDFLHKGKMIKPKKFFCGKNKFTIEDGSEISVDKVLTAAYRYKRKNAQFLVNYNVQPVEVNFETEVTLYTDFRLNEKRRVKTTELQPLSVAMIKI